MRFLQLSPGEYFFTTLKVAGYTGVLLSAPSIIYEVAAFVVPGLTKSERNFLGPIVGGSSVLFYTGYADLPACSSHVARSLTRATRSPSVSSFCRRQANEPLARRLSDEH